MRRKLVIMAAVLAAMLVVTEVAQAYIVPPFYICRLFFMGRRKLRIESLSMALDVSIVTGEGDEGEHSMEGRLFFKIPQQMRLVLSGGDGKSAVLVEKGGVRSMTPGSAELALLPKHDVMAQFFATFRPDSEDMAAVVIEQLKRLGVDTKQVSLRRGERDNVQYLIGAKPWETDKPQMWFSKGASQLPLHYSWRGPGLDGKDHGWSVNLNDWGSSITGNWFPGQVEYIRDGKLVMRWRVEKIDRNQGIPATLFTSLQGG